MVFLVNRGENCFPFISYWHPPPNNQLTPFSAFFIQTLTFQINKSCLTITKHSAKMNAFPCIDWPSDLFTSFPVSHICHSWVLRSLVAVVGAPHYIYLIEKNRRSGQVTLNFSQLVFKRKQLVLWRLSI